MIRPGVGADAGAVNALMRARAEGFVRLDLMATLPGVPLYQAFGFREVERVGITMPDGVTITGVVMDRPISMLPA